jgi:hypothetical protein
MKSLYISALDASGHASLTQPQISALNACVPRSVESRRYRPSTSPDTLPNQDGALLQPILISHSTRVDMTRRVAMSAREAAPRRQTHLRPPS